MFLLRIGVAAPHQYLAPIADHRMTVSRPHEAKAFDTMHEAAALARIVYPNRDAYVCTSGGHPICHVQEVK
jgi:hypothetical protein